MRADPMRHALAILSEGGRLTPDQEAAFLVRGPSFIRAGNIGFVVIDGAAASSVLRGMAIKAFRLEHVESSGMLDLYVPHVERPDGMAQPAVLSP